MTELDGMDAQIAREKAAKHPMGVNRTSVMSSEPKAYKLPVTTAEEASKKTLSNDQ